MADKPNIPALGTYYKFAITTLCMVIALVVVCLAFRGTINRPSSSVITGELQVSYMLITSKTASSEEASGGTINASQVEYFPNYVLVTTDHGTTHLWSIDRLKKFEVMRMPFTGDQL